MHHVKGDFLGALGVCWDLRLRPDHPTVVTVRLRVRQCTGLKKNLSRICRRLGRFRHMSELVDRVFLVFARDDFFEVAHHGPKTPNDLFFVVVRDKEPEDMVAENNGSLRKWWSDAVAKTPAQPRPRSGRGPIHASAINYSKVDVDAAACRLTCQLQ